MTGQSLYSALLGANIGGKQWPPMDSAFGRGVVTVLDREILSEKQGRISDKNNAVSAPIPRKRNALLDALVSACGGDPNTTTKTAFRSAATALSEIKTVCPDLTTEEINRRAEKYKREHRDWPLTCPSLAKWWSHLSENGGARTHSEQLNIYAEPSGWRGVLQNMYQLSNEGIRDKHWLDLGPDTRREILKKMRTA